MKKRQTAPVPIQYGDLIPGTQLRRRWQGPRELHPEYQGVHRPSDQDGVAVTAGMADCDAVGQRAFMRGGVTFARMGSEWLRLGSEA